MKWALELERLRNKNTMRHRAKSRVTDITAQDAVNLRHRAKVCADCGSPLVSDLSKRHIDHIIPLRPEENIYGTHTKDNVRVVCASCNLKKGNRMNMLPATQLNLFMASHESSAKLSAIKPPLRHRISRACVTCGNDSVPDHRAWRHDFHCYSCKPLNAMPEKSSYDGKYDMGTVVMLRRCGDGYKKIAKSLGTSRSTARELVKRAEKIGLVPA